MVFDTLLISAVIAVGFLAAVAFYESMSTRDVLVAQTTTLARRRSSRLWVTGLTYTVTVVVGIPLLVVLWTVVLEVFLIAVGSVEQLGSVAVVAASIVGAARILAYARQPTSHELAKAIPLAFAFILLTGGALNLNDNLRRLVAEPERSRLTLDLLGFLVLLEIGLRVLNDGSHFALARVRQQRGVTSDIGVWRTIWIALRRPVAEAVPEPGGSAGRQPDDAPS